MAREDDLLHEALAALARVLGDGFDITPYDAAAVPARTRPDDAADTFVTLFDRDGGLSVTLFVEARRALDPALVRRELAPRFQLLRRVPSAVPPLVVAPWLSPRTRDELTRLDVNYLDLTGNVSIDLRRPRLLLKLEGDRRDPRPRREQARGLAGPKAARLVRLLAEVIPPFRASDLAQAGQLSLPYVSRLLDAIEDRGLVERRGRAVVHVDWDGVLRERAAATNLLRTNTPLSFVARRGVPYVMDSLSAGVQHDAAAVTGSFSARAVAPVAAGGQLMIYVPPLARVDGVADALGLMRTDGDGDVLLLRAGDEGVGYRPRQVGGAWHVGLTQLVLDCLSGPGRLPAEGEAVLEVMAQRLDSWRLPAMPPPPTEGETALWREFRTD